jgi:hypothetical protein
VTPVRQIVDGLDLPVVDFADSQEGYTTLPAYATGFGLVVIRWKLSWRERLRILLHGDLWLSVRTFEYKLQPTKLETDMNIDKLVELVCESAVLSRCRGSESDKCSG